MAPSCWFLEDKLAPAYPRPLYQHGLPLCVAVYLCVLLPWWWFTPFPSIPRRYKELAALSLFYLATISLCWCNPIADSAGKIATGSAYSALNTILYCNGAINRGVQIYPGAYGFLINLEKFRKLHTANVNRSIGKPACKYQRRKIHAPSISPNRLLRVLTVSAIS